MPTHATPQAHRSHPRRHRGAPVPAALVEPVEEMEFRREVLEHVRELVSGGQHATIRHLIDDLVALAADVVRPEDREELQAAGLDLFIAMWRGARS